MLYNVIIYHLHLRIFFLNKVLSVRSMLFQQCKLFLIMQVIAKRLLESKQTTPHLYLSKGLYSYFIPCTCYFHNIVNMMICFTLLSDVVLDPLLAFRNELKGVLYIFFYLMIFSNQTTFIIFNSQITGKVLFDNDFVHCRATWH